MRELNMKNDIIFIMQDPEIRKALGAHMKKLRKQKGWSQKELAKRIDGSYQQLNKYESGLHSPPLHKLIQIAEALDTTIDYLILGQITGIEPIHSRRLFERFKVLESFEPNNQETVISLIDAMIAKQKMERALIPVN